MTRLRMASLFALLLLGAGCGHASSSQHAAELPPADPVAVRAFVAGVRLMNAGGRARTRRARARFERALVVDPNLWEAHYNLGVLDRRAEAPFRLRVFLDKIMP